MVCVPANNKSCEKVSQMHICKYRVMMDSPLVEMLVIKMTINFVAFSLLMENIIVSDVNSTSFVTEEWGWLRMMNSHLCE